jgi:hypothetical protein
LIIRQVEIAFAKGKIVNRIQDIGFPTPFLPIKQFSLAEKCNSAWARFL